MPSTDHGDTRRYFVQLPHIVMDDLRLDPYAKTLYWHYKRVAGETHTCTQARATVCEATGIGRTKLVDARQQLIDYGYIEVEQSDGHYTNEVRILDVWPQNMARYARSDEPTATRSVEDRPTATRSVTVHEAVGDRPPDGPKEDVFKKNLEDPVVEDARAQDLAVLWAQIGIVNGLTTQNVDEAVEEYSQDWVRRAIRVTGRLVDGERKPSWEYVLKILMRWKAEGGPDDEKPRQMSHNGGYGRAQKPNGAAGRSVGTYLRASADSGKRAADWFAGFRPAGAG